MDNYQPSQSVLTMASTSITVAYVFWGINIFTFTKDKYLKSPEVALPFFYTKREHHRVDEFIRELKAARRNYFRRKFMRVDEYTPVESQLHTFRWLHGLKYINDAELKHLVEEAEAKKVIRGM